MYLTRSPFIENACLSFAHQKQLAVTPYQNEGLRRKTLLRLPSLERIMIVPFLDVEQQPIGRYSLFLKTAINTVVQLKDNVNAMDAFTYIEFLFYTRPYLAAFGKLQAKEEVMLLDRRNNATLFKTENEVVPYLMVGRADVSFIYEMMQNRFIALHHRIPIDEKVLIQGHGLRNALLYEFDNQTRQCLSIAAIPYSLVRSYDFAM